MELQRVPLDIAKIIWVLLDFNDLGMLYATLNRPIQFLLSYPGILDLLRPPVDMKPLARYFLRSISNVSRVELEAKLDWSPRDVALLRVLNPVSLKLSTGCFGNITNFTSADGSEGAQLPLRRFGLPDFALLTPRLVSLTCCTEPADLFFYSNLSEAQQKEVIDSRGPLALDWSLPSSLTSFSCDFGSLREDDVLNALPVTLRDLHLVFSGPRTLRLSLLSQHLSLEILAINVTGGMYVDLTDDLFQLPNTLTELSLGPFQWVPLNFLTHLILPSTSLRKLHLQTGTETEDSRKTIDLAPYLPPTLASLSLTWSDPNYSPICQIVGFPQTLTELYLTTDHHDYLVLSAIYALKSLLRLDLNFENGYQVQASASSQPVGEDDNLDPKFDSAPVLSLILLPRSLKYLLIGQMDLEALTEDKILALPPQLSTLFVSSLDLNSILLFHEKRPNCALNISKPIDFWRSESMPAVRESFKNLWSPQLDISAFANSVRSYYALRKIFFNFDFSLGKLYEGRDLQFKDVTSLICCPALNSPILVQRFLYEFPNFAVIRNAFQNLQKLVMKLPTLHFMFSDQIPPNLTHLEVSNIRITIRGADLPCTLRTIIDETYSTPAGHAFTFEQFPNLTHLNAPNWYFSVAEYYNNQARWKHYSLNALHARITGLKDVNVIDFLTKKLTPQTRRNANIWLFYSVTGELFARNDPEYANRLLLTNARLLALLKEPMPPAIIGSSPNPDDCIGRIVTKLTEGF